MSNNKELKEGFAEFDNVKLYYEMAGKGFPLVLVHAGICDRRMWDDQFPLLAQEYQTIRYDMRGYGNSLMSGGQFSHRGDLYQLLRFLDIKQAHFVGCSMGGMTVIDFALEHPEMVKSLVLVSSALSGYPYQGEPPQAIFEYITARKEGHLKRAAELQVQIWVDGAQRSADMVDPKIREQVYEMGLTALSNQVDWMKETGFVMEEPLQPPAFGRLDSLSFPTLSIVGDLDDASVADISEALVKHIVGCRSVVIKNTTHLPNMEKPDEFNQIILDFLHRSS
jgi:pimeloyl-ACP methyl ester carboxylesterase